MLKVIIPYEQRSQRIIVFQTTLLVKMTSIHRSREKRRLRAVLRSSDDNVASIWTGRKRPGMPWRIRNNLYERQRKRRTPRVLRHH